MEINPEPISLSPEFALSMNAETQFCNHN